MNDKKPIKRSKVLAEFSREHHFGLLLVWKIRQGLKAGIVPERMAKYIAYFFEKELMCHFADEEKFLFVFLDKNSPLRIRAESDHAEINQLIEQIRLSNMNIKVIEQFANKLEEHIRFEERELFNHIQNSLSDLQLKNLAGQLIKKNIYVENGWPDEFWATKK